MAIKHELIDKKGNKLEVGMVVTTFSQYPEKIFQITRIREDGKLLLDRVGSGYRYRVRRIPKNVVMVEPEDLI